MQQDKENEKLTNFQNLILQRKKPKISEIQFFLDKFIQIQQKESTLINVNEPLFIIGSLHGHLEDFLTILDLIDKPPSSTLLFLGNYLNFGPDQFYLYMYIITLKLQYPKFVYMLRGGHESQTINKIFGFYAEILNLFKNDLLWRQITQTFQYLSIVAILQQSKIICMAGGFSPQIQKLNQIEKIKCKNEINSDSILSDLLWSVPQFDDTIEEFKFAQSGMGYIYPLKKTQQFLEQNKLKKLIRTDQFIKQGIQYSQQQKVISIFSCLELNKQKIEKGFFLYVNQNGEIIVQIKKKKFYKIIKKI